MIGVEPAQHAEESRVVGSMEAPAHILPAAERLELALGKFPADILEGRVTSGAQHSGRRRAGQHRGVAVAHSVAAFAQVGQRSGQTPIPQDRRGTRAQIELLGFAVLGVEVATGASVALREAQCLKSAGPDRVFGRAMVTRRTTN